MTAMEIVPTENMAALDSLDAATREQAITSALEQANSWLAHVDVATARTEDIANFKAYVATVEEATRRLRASRECQQHAQVVTRRAERTLGLSIRAGQNRGDIESRESSARTMRRKSLDGDPVRTAISPSKFFNGGGHVAHETYALTDDVTDDEFDEALDRAQAEENVSRANVVRKVREVKDGNETHETKWARIEELANQSHTSRQIAGMVGMSLKGLRQGARNRGLKFPADRFIGKTRAIDTNRVIRESVHTLEGVVMSLDLINPDDIDQEAAQEWVDSLTSSISALTKAKKKIKESIQ